MPFELPLRFGKKRPQDSLVILLLFLASWSCISIKSLKKKIWGSVYIFYGSLTIFTASLIDIILVNILGNFDFYVIQYGSLAFLYMQAMAAGSRELVYLQKIRDAEEMRKHSYAQLAKIVYPHQMKMIQGGKILEDTMPTSDSEAIVISFDIIGSSRIHRYGPRQHQRFLSGIRRQGIRCLRSFGDPGHAL